MTHTLTGLGIALVLALAAALIGPFFIDWGNHRAAFEAQASKLLGVPVRVQGDVEARLLPSPRIRFGHVVAGDSWDSAKLEAESFSLDLALMPLISGEYRVRNLTVDRAKVKAALAANGELNVPFRAGGMTRADLDRVLVEKFAITNSQITLADPAANRSFVLDGVNLTGEASALAGPLKIEGQGTMNGARYELRAATGQFDTNGAGRVKVTVQTDAAPTLDLEGTLLVGAAPRFAGNAVMAQAGAPAVDGKPAREAWKIRAGIKADPRRIIAETLDVQHGDEGSGMHLAGTGELTLMRGVPSAVVNLSARQVDIDRSLGRPKDAPPLPPAAALAAFAERVPAPPASALSLRTKLAVENVVLAGDIVQNLRAELATAPSGWTVDNVSFRAPGGGDVKTAGALTFEGGPGYAGLFAVDAPNLPTLVHWLEGSSGKRPDIAIKRLKLEGDLAARPGAYALQDFRMAADGAEVTGRLAWSGQATGRPKLEARLAADKLDLDALDPSRVAALFGGSGAGGTDLEIALKAKQLTYAKTAWKQVDVDLSTSPDGVDVRRLTVADLGGARIDAKGRLAERNGRPDGKLEARIEAASLNGLISVARQSGVPAELVDQLGSRAQFLAPASLKAVVESAQGTNRISGRLTGTLGGSSVEIQASAEPHAIANTLNGTLKASSQNEAWLVGQLGVPVVALQTGGAANVEASMHNDGKGAASIDAKYSAEGTSLAFKGTLKGSDLAGRADLATEDAARYAVMLGRAPEAGLPVVPLSLGGNVAYGPAGASVDKLAGFVQGRALSGKLDIRDKDGITGEIDIASLSLTELLGAALGPLALSGADEAGWPSGPAGPGLFEGLNGRVAVKAGALELTTGYVAGSAAFTLALSRNEFAVQDARAVLAGGELKGNLAVRRTDAEASVAARFALTGASLRDLVWASARPAAVGTLDVTADMLGNGTTLSHILASLAGSGSATLRDGRLAALDPGAFERTFAAVENGGTPPDAAGIATRFQTELLLGDLNVSEIASAFTIGSGVVRAQNAAITAADAEVTGSGVVDLPKGLVTAELTLRPKTFAESGDGSVPQADFAFSGPLTAPGKQIDTNALANFLTARALEREVKRVEQMEAEKRERERLAAEAEALRVAEEAEAQRIRAITESTGQVPLPALPPPVQIAPPRRAPPSAAPEQTRSIPRRQSGSPFDIFRRPALPLPEVSR